MKISPEAKIFLAEFLEDNEGGFLRISQITVGGGCCAKLVLGVSIDSEFNANDDLKLDIEGLLIVIEKDLHKRFNDISIEISPESGLVVKHA